MIRILESFEQVGEAVLTLQKRGCPLHSTPQKNWDMAQILGILDNEKPNWILDMGCGGLHVLTLCRDYGVPNIFGVDLEFRLIDRLRPYLYAIRDKSTKLPYRLIRGNLTKTSFPNNSFDLITCLSVIEHGVNVESFLKEASRLLRQNGKLYVSTDYWEPKISVEKSIRPFGLSWNIFSKEEIKDLVNRAKKCNLLIEDENIPSPKEKVVHWNGKDYTYISLIFKKVI
jgi:SAM-dependent methyltransferase